MTDHTKLLKQLDDPTSNLKITAITAATVIRQLQKSLAYNISAVDKADKIMREPKRIWGVLEEVTFSTSLVLSIHRTKAKAEKVAKAHDKENNSSALTFRVIKWELDG